MVTESGVARVIRLFVLQPGLIPVKPSVLAGLTSRLRFAFIRKAFQLFTAVFLTHTRLFLRSSGFIQSAKMLSRFYLPELLILLLWTILHCASCAPLKPCVKCALSCDGAAELEKHQSVRVLVEHQSETVHEKTRSVSSLFTGEHCSVVVPDCSKWGSDALFTLKMYADDKESVSEPFYEETAAIPDCASVDSQNIRNDADRNHSNKLLILLSLCICIFFYIKRPRCAACSHGSFSSAKIKNGAIFGL